MKRKWAGPLLIAAMVLLALWAFPRLPAEVPSHWNAQGEVDDWSSRWIVLVPPGISLLVWLLMQGLRRVDPRASNYERFEPTFWLIVNLTILIMAVVHVMTIGAALGWPLPAVDVIMIISFGVLLLMLGNVLPRVRSNWWMGVRTPWTLSSERVWRSTHRLAGRTFVLGGLIVLSGLLLPSEWRLYLVMVAIGVSALVPAVWSWFDWRREQRGPPDPGQAAGNRLP